MNSNNNEDFMPIGILTPFMDSWTIKARVTKKQPKRTFNNQRGDGQVFSIDIIDSNGTEINCSFFNKAVDKFYDLIEEKQIYAFSKGKVKTSNLKYGQKNDYQIVFDERSEITKFDDEDGEIATNKFTFQKLSDIVAKSAKGSQIDIIAIVKNVSKTETIKLKKEQNNNQQTLRKLVTLYDDSLQLIDMTLWGEHANLNLNNGQIIIVKDSKINEFNSVKNIQFNFNSTLISDTNTLRSIPEYTALLNWQRTVNQNQLNLNQQQMGEGVGAGGSGGLKSCVSVQQMEDQCAKMQEEGNNSSDPLTSFCDVIGCINYINPDGVLYYLSCSGNNCQKKVIEQNGKFHCDYCNKDFDSAIARYTFSARIADETGISWVNFYDTAGHQLFNEQANFIKDLKNADQMGQVQQIIKGQWFRQMKFKMILKTQIYNGETKISKQVYKVEKDIDFKNEFKDLLGEINKYKEQYQLEC